MSTLQLFDTYERKIRAFEPLIPGKVGLYCCGPTVYNYAHIGNLRTYVFEDILLRVLRQNGYEVDFVMNITDVGHLTSDADSGEDKMELGSKRTGMSAWEMADFYTQAFKTDLQRLNILGPNTWCRATDHIKEQIEFIDDLERKGFTYRTSDGIYFNSRKLKNYGHLARLDIEGLMAGARVDNERKHVTDFALWKFSPEGEKRQMEWESPWGIGFPGWHIECSAMSAKYLGDYFDIHCGGEDHIPIHHTNEIAQTEASRGTRLANFWMHGYFLQLDNNKMSKSTGEFLRLETLLERDIDPLVYRYFCLTAHYRTQMSFSWDSLESNQVALNRLYQAAFDWGEPGEVIAEIDARFMACINDDLNLPRALAVVWELVKSDHAPQDKKATLLKFDAVLGLDIATWQPKVIDVPKEIQQMALDREAARQDKQWQRADELRDAVLAAGYVIEDTHEGPKVKKP
ncbi:MAG: cysteine--tRNA ligase [Pseudomonadales bacterium]|nr:cysteine--tRNA ligase [Pseudomonadales bacterium]MDG1441929.1 cysteine--tRNA ligase [Pseudomonadales bacterium]